MNGQSIEKAIEIINFSIQNGVSLKEGCRLNGKGGEYVKDVKRRYFDALTKGDITKEMSERMVKAISEYETQKENGFIKKTLSVNTEIKQPVEKNQLIVSGNDIAKDIEFKCTDSSRIKTLDQLLKEAKVDKRIWQVKDFTVNKWDTSSIRNGQPQVLENFQVKARLEKLQAVSDAYDAAKIFKDLCDTYKPKNIDYVLDTDANSKENNLFEVSIFDLHMGKLGWHGEVGEDYDTKIASSRFLTSIKKLIDRAMPFGFNRILFPIGSDFFNSDNHNNTTTAGTPQDEDLRWQKTFTLGCELIVDGINLLKACGVPVDVVVIPGNHDFERSYYMGSFIQAWFRNDNMVNVDNSASPRKYYQFEKVLLGLTHGDSEKQDSLPMLMATEQKKMWGETEIHEWHCGHLHRKKTFKYKTQSVNEDLGVTIRYLSSLTGTEEWHHKRGYVGALKAAEGFIWCGETGLVGHLNTNIMVGNTLAKK